MSEPGSRVCIFCGHLLSGHKSQEHIFPQWLQKRLGLEKRPIYPTLYYESGEVNRVRQTNFNAYVSGLVCRSCNNGWLSDLETRTKPLLESLVDGTFTGVIDPQSCKLLARWISKTALVLHSTSQQGRFIPVEHYLALYKGEPIPEGIVVSIAPIQGEDEFYWIQNQNWLGRTQDTSLEKLKAEFEQTYRIVFRIGNLAARTHYWKLSNWRLVDYFQSSLRYIWPIGSNGITWPPPERNIKVLQELDESIMIMGKRAGNN